MLTTFEHEPSRRLQASSTISDNRRHPLVPHHWTPSKQLLYRTILISNDNDWEISFRPQPAGNGAMSAITMEESHHHAEHLPWCETSRQLELLDPRATSPWRGKVTLRPHPIDSKRIAADCPDSQSDRKAMKRSANATQARISMRMIPRSLASLHFARASALARDQ
jgi:hypothetical protein